MSDLMVAISEPQDVAKTGKVPRFLKRPYSPEVGRETAQYISVLLFSKVIRSFSQCHIA